MNTQNLSYVFRTDSVSLCTFSDLVNLVLVNLLLCGYVIVEYLYIQRFMRVCFSSFEEVCKELYLKRESPSICFTSLSKQVRNFTNKPFTSDERQAKPSHLQ